MASFLEALPPPRSGLPLEVSFRRLLKSCEEIVAGDDKGRQDLQDYATSPVFHAVCFYDCSHDRPDIPNLV